LRERQSGQARAASEAKLLCFARHARWNWLPQHADEKHSALVPTGERQMAHATGLSASGAAVLLAAAGVLRFGVFRLFLASAGVVRLGVFRLRSDSRDRTARSAGGDNSESAVDEII
tara:strand:+ start:900 stop:1250 length:351 start_codon:yes stop_codon:yes gene_type:complete